MLKSFRNASMAIAAAGLAFAVPASAAPATHIAPGAHAAVIGDMSFEHKRQRSHGHDRNRNNDYRGAQSRPYYMGYDRQYGQPVRANTRVWRGNDGRYYCKRDNGTTGLLVGAGVGALLGHEVAGSGGDRTLGAILGGAAGALLGRSIDRSSTRCG
ncbi:MAG: glycine zipper 2TM domain-containing protein [Erythrobacter sp.]|jgi:hypothetical protein|uniref:glycine zipper 2TM domain-containing protein n=1 Tax=Qipengyuania TaxID=1855416 RepID=UPI001A63CE76|nr:glycine zipper 2TM domain-containing protein [Qipengyuania citrea]MBL4717943.1 glycine zipper 2TM domain-containing protein [Erythrobacter sp.]MCP2016956.1 hypothetical protein [Qipengyuania citrea]MDE0901002.1 glycine zipper 2TM domain-containing protein [Erythrobacter sp.]